MNNDIHEQLSALVDDELSDAESALLVRRLAADSDLRHTLSRYHLVSDSIHDNLPRQVDCRFHERVRAALQDEAAIHAVPRSTARWYRPVAGFALAASVAVVAVLTLQNTREDNGPAADMQALATVPSPDNFIRAENVSAPGLPSTRAPGLEDVYLVNHNEFAANRGMQGMLPYARIVGQETLPDSNGDHE
jgi:sigma-E factor negative regulatory protein RseA